MLTNRLAALVGETGTGKTLLARKIAQELTGEYEFIVASYGYTKKDLLYYLGLAAKEGKIVIIDGLNYILPAVLLESIDAFCEAKPGQKIPIGSKEVEVKPGFGVILTGNITRSGIQDRYVGEKTVRALANRLNSGFIEYGLLPQSHISFEESILDEEELGKKKIPNRELFEVGLSLLADEKGNISGPKDLLKKTWDLSVLFSDLQKIYAGEKLETSVKLPGGEDMVLKEYAISNRTFRAVLEQWENDNFRYSSDWYIYNNLIRPASLVSSSEAGQIFAYLKGTGMFFQDKSWDALKPQSTTYRLEGIEEIERNQKDFLRSQELKEPTYYFTPQEVSEALMGVRMPSIEKVVREKNAREERKE
ncbi:AAA family ATPase [bacterium]|nr:AAA family ATPase [bacterium]